MQIDDYNTNFFPTWCPGCGNLPIWSGLKEAFIQLGWTPDSFVVVYDIGCAGNMADFVKSYGFHALHGRVIPIAVGIRLANHQLPVICITGDGGAYGEGLNHLVSACRGNFDITVVVHDNNLYSLTTGQASPTSLSGMKTKSTPTGSIETPLNPLALAITQGATFVGQGFAGDPAHLKELLVAAINHKGFSLVNVLQPCVTFNKVNTFAWYRERVYRVEDNPNRGKPRSNRGRLEAIGLTVDKEKIPLGVIYQEERKTYEEQLPQLASGPLVSQPPNLNIENFLKELS